MNPTNNIYSYSLQIKIKDKYLFKKGDKVTISLGGYTTIDLLVQDYSDGVLIIKNKSEKDCPLLELKFSHKPVQVLENGFPYVERDNLESRIIRADERKKCIDIMENMQIIGYDDISNDIVKQFQRKLGKILRAKMK